MFYSTMHFNCSRDMVHAHAVDNCVVLSIAVNDQDSVSIGRWQTLVNKLFSCIYTILE